MNRERQQQPLARKLSRDNSRLYHFRSLDDILGFNSGSRAGAAKEDRVGVFASTLAKDILATSSVFAEHSPLRLMSSVDSWVSSGRGSDRSCSREGLQTEQSPPVQQQGLQHEPLKSTVTLQEKRRLTRKKPLASPGYAPAPPLTLSLNVTTDSSLSGANHSDLATCSTSWQTVTATRTHGLAPPPAATAMTNTGQQTEHCHAVSASHQHKTTVVHVAGHDDGQNSGSRSATAVADGDFPADNSARRAGHDDDQEEVLSSSESEDEVAPSLVQIPHINARAQSLPNYGRSPTSQNDVGDPGTKQTLSVRKSASFKVDRSEVSRRTDSSRNHGERRWSFASLDLLATHSANTRAVGNGGVEVFDDEQRRLLVVGARYASASSIADERSEVSPTSLQLLRSHLHETDVHDLAISPVSRSSSGAQQSGAKAKRKHGKGTKKSTRKRRESKSGAKKRNAFSRFWSRLFGPSKRGPRLRETSIQAEEGNVGRHSFPPSRTHPTRNNRHVRGHKLAVPQLSTVTSSSYTSLPAAQNSPPPATAAPQSSDISGPGEQRLSSGGQAQIDSAVESACEQVVTPETLPAPTLEPQASALKRSSSWRSSLRRSMNRIKNFTVRRHKSTRESPSSGKDSTGQTAPHGIDSAEHEEEGFVVESISEGGGVVCAGDLLADGEPHGADADTMEIISIASGSSHSSHSVDARTVLPNPAERPPYQRGLSSSSAPALALASTAVDRTGYKEIPDETWSSKPAVDTAGGRSADNGGQWAHTSVAVRARRRAGTMPLVRIINPAEEANLVTASKHDGDGGDVVHRNVPPEKRELRRVRSKSLEPTTFDAASALGPPPKRSIPISPSWSSSLDRGKTLPPSSDAGHLYPDGLGYVPVRRSSSQRAARIHAVAASASASISNMLSPESRNSSSSWSNLLKGRRGSALLSGESNKQVQNTGFMPPLGLDSYSRSMQQLNTIPGKDGHYGVLGGESEGCLLDSSHGHSTPPVTTLHPPNKPKNEMQQDVSVYRM